MIETCIGPSLSKIHSELLTVRVGETAVSAEIYHKPRTQVCFEPKTAPSSSHTDHQMETALP